MRQLVDNLAQLEPVEKPISSAQLSGKWELLYTTVELFRASPFFQMVSVDLRFAAASCCFCALSYIPDAICSVGSPVSPA